MSVRRIHSFILFSLLVASVAGAQTLQRPVPFKLPVHDTTFSQYLPMGSDIPAGKHGALHLDSSGHIIALDGTRLRFFGTELDFSANFITQTDAHTLALRLRKLGFNAVRMNYDDYYGYNDYSFFEVYDSLGNYIPSSYTINWQHFANFDTLLYEFKQAGIYAFLTLNSSYHTFGTADGIPNHDSVNSYFYFFDRYTEPRAAALERQWVRTLLTHLNPLTGLQYAQDPSIAVAEIAWENSLYLYWEYGYLNYIDSNNTMGKGSNTMCYSQSRQLDTLYSTYLRNKYHTDAALNYGWQGNPNPSQQNLMDDGSFEQQGSAAWSFPAPANGAQAAFVDADGGEDSTIFKKIRITSLGPNPSLYNIYGLNTSPSSLCHKDSLYELTFWAKMPYSSARPGKLTRQLYLDMTGGTSYITIDTSWKEYRYTFRCQVTGIQSIYLFMGDSLGDVWLDAFGLHHKAELGLLPGESLATSTVIRFTTANIAMFPLQRVRDQMMFQDSLQDAYYMSIGRLIKDTLHFKGLVNYSQANYWGSPPDEYMNSFGDVTEGHTAWDGYGTRAGKTYSDTNAIVSNVAELTSLYGGNMCYYLPAHSVAGKAFLATMTVPNMSQMSAEQMLLLPSYAALQDWDGVFFTPYAYVRNDLFPDSIINYFLIGSSGNAISTNGAMLALAPAASNMFQNGYIQPATFSQNVLHDPDDVFLNPLITSGRGPWGVEGYLDPNIITSIKVRQQFDASKHRVAAQYAYVTDTSVKRSITNELLWDQTNGLFTISAPKLNGAAGFFGMDTFALSGIKFSRLDNTRDMFSLYYLSEDSLALDSSARSLITISPRVQNSGMYWPDSIGFGPNWGTTPMLMNAQRVHVSIESAFDSVLIFPLDSMGRLVHTGDFTDAIAEIDAEKENDSHWYSAVIDQTQYHSVWFYVVKKNAADAVARTLSENFTISLSPNPASVSATLRIASPKELRVSVALIDDLGREVESVAKNEAVRATKTLEINTSTLAAGHYIVKITTPERTEVRSLNVIR